MRFKWGYPDTDSKTVQVVGVVGDVLYTSLRDRAEPTFYLVEAQEYPLWRPAIVVTPRAGDAAALVPGIRAALQAFDPHAVVTFELAPDIVAATLSRQRLGMTLMVIFGITAVTLAAIGIYGVIAYRSSQRGDEIATRIALGASSGRVFWLMMRSGQRLALAGIVLGLVGAFAGGRVVASSVYAMRAADPLILIAATVVVAAVTFLATAIPAVRASRVDPVRSLRL
jgi:putative ABC transport system permease protein